MSNEWPGWLTLWPASMFGASQIVTLTKNHNQSAKSQKRTSN